MVEFRFPFGRPITACRPLGDGPREAFVLGAYPSALHVRWTPPEGWRRVQALAVDNEPEPFWTGEDEVERIDAWLADVEWRDEWGSAQGVANLNGPSGSWVEHNVLERLGLARRSAWITDCLDTYRASSRMATAIASVYDDFAATTKDLRPASLATHPTESAIVTEALKSHLQRLRSELATAGPAVVVSLGNAALRVVRALVGDRRVPRALRADGDYGRPIRIDLEGRSVTWYPLAHPAAPSSYQSAHRAWSPST